MGFGARVMLSGVVLGTFSTACAGHSVDSSRAAARNADAASDGKMGEPSETGGATRIGCPNWPPDPATAPVSFRNDVMPIFALSCIASSCHSLTPKKADLVLGDPSACSSTYATTCYDPNAKWKYSFPGPVPETLVATVLSNLVNVPSKIVSSVMRVAPGDPAHSFLLDTVMGTENSKPYSNQCTNTNPEVTASPCGTDMPLGQPGGFCVDGDPLSAQRVEAIARWIQQGAQNN